MTVTRINLDVSVDECDRRANPGNAAFAAVVRAVHAHLRLNDLKPGSGWHAILPSQKSDGFTISLMLLD